MADGGMSPVGDPGNLSIYSLHGSGNKMVELVSDTSGNMDMLPCQPNGNHAIYPGASQAALYPVQNDFTSGSYIQVDPLNYGESSSYAELKRSEEDKRVTMPSYYATAVNMQNTDGMFDNHSFGNYQTNQQQILKTNSDSMGYIQLLSNAETLDHDLTIKKEKLDYSDELNMMNSQSPDIPYPPNTCISDWSFYNSPVNIPSGSENMNHSERGFNVFQVPSQHQQHQQQYLTAGPMYENNSHMPQISLGLSNEDIHHQAKKISHELMSTSWNSENLYKSPVYSNVIASDSMNRKRKPELEKASRPVKSRKKKTDNMDGHSKTVASILMGDNALPSASGSRSWLDNDVLDSTDRNTLLSSLMDNLRSTVQFESFCLSFPRSQGKEDAFRRKIIHTINMINDIPGLTLKSNPIPLEYLSRASKIISSFRNALLNTGNEDDTQAMTGDKFNNLRSDQVEEHLPHSMVWAVKLGDHLLTANWEGQFVATVNPLQGILSFSLFQFQPSFSGDGIKCLQNAKLTKSLAKDIVENMEQFEVSRQLRFDVRLQSITQIYLFMSGLDRDSGCLVLEVAENPAYYQRWVHCSAENKNKWRRRRSFFKPTRSRSCRCIYIGGLTSEISELLALILASSRDLEQLYEQGTRQPLNMDLSEMYTHENGLNPLDDVVDIGTDNDERSNGFVKHTSRLGKNSKTLRGEIVGVLVSYGIVRDAHSVTIVGGSEPNGNNIGDANGDYCVNLGIHLDKNISECFRDYINYTCSSAIELNRLLAFKVNPSSYGFCDSDFDLSKVPGRNIEQLTVGQLISTRCSEVVYFSFCSKQIGQLGHEKHCTKCQSCNTWRFWHCDTCNRCTDSGRVCEFCGHLRDDQSRLVIKPLSVFKSQEDAGKLVLDVDKEQWKASLNFPNDDVIVWEFPKLPLADNTNCVMQYDSTTAMVDQLGLINPVGFLLGLPAASASRKHRRYKESLSFGKQPDSMARNSKSAAASGCNLQ